MKSHGPSIIFLAVSVFLICGRLNAATFIFGSDDTNFGMNSLGQEIYVPYGKDMNSQLQGRADFNNYSQSIRPNIFVTKPGDNLRLFINPSDHNACSVRFNDGGPMKQANFQVYMRTPNPEIKNNYLGTLGNFEINFNKGFYFEGRSFYSNSKAVNINSITYPITNSASQLKPYINQHLAQEVRNLNHLAAPMDNLGSYAPVYQLRDAGIYNGQSAVIFSMAAPRQSFRFNLAGPYVGLGDRILFGRNDSLTGIGASKEIREIRYTALPFLGRGVLTINSSGNIKNYTALTQRVSHNNHISPFPKTLQRTLPFPQNTGKFQSGTLALSVHRAPFPKTREAIKEDIRGSTLEDSPLLKKSAQKYLSFLEFNKRQIGSILEYTNSKTELIGDIFSRYANRADEILEVQQGLKLKTILVTAGILGGSNKENKPQQGLLKTAKIKELLNKSGYNSIIKAQEIPLDIAAIVWIESRGDPKAKSKDNCYGLTQIGEGALKDYNEWRKKVSSGDSDQQSGYTISDLFNDKKNLEIGTWYLAKRIPQILRAYGIPVTVDNILISYNWGAGNLNKYQAQLNQKLPRETRNYLINYRNLINSTQIGH